MTGRTIIIISLFVAVLIVVNTFIFLYREQTDLLIEKAIAQFTVCENILDENVCFDKSFCQGIYGPSCPGCQDSVFLECKKISSKDRTLFTARKSLCDNTRGKWISDIRGGQCSCSQAGPNKTFNPFKGCIDK